MALHRVIALAVACVATSAPAAIIYQETVDPGQGNTVATVDALFAPHDRVWVQSSAGPLISSLWNVDGQRQAYWWEPFYDPDGNETHVLNGEEYLWDPQCATDLSSPTCGEPGILQLDMGGSLLKAVFTPPQGFDFCDPFPGYYIDCRVSYSITDFEFFVSAATPDSQPVTFTFYDSAPVPEPASWALLMAGFALTGAALRQRRLTIA